MKSLLGQMAYSGPDQYMLKGVTKRIRLVRLRSRLRRVAPAQVNTDKYRYNLVFEDPWWSRSRRNNGIAIVG